MKELNWVLQFFPMKDIMMTSLVVHLMKSPWDERTKVHWDLQMEMQMDLN